MQETLEVTFCDLCNASVPERDLEIGAAARVHGRVVGACCLRALRGEPATARQAQSGSRPAMASAAVVLLAAIAGATAFLDWRLADETERIDGGLRTVASGLADQHDRLPSMEQRLAGLGTSGEVAEVGRRVAEVEAGIQQAITGVADHLAGLDQRIGKLEEGLRSIADAQPRHDSEVQRVAAELRALGVEVEAALSALDAKKAAAAAAPPVTPPAAESSVAPAPAEPGLPDELATQVERLHDDLPATRFEAAFKLIQSKDPLVLPALLKAASDEDPLVRRLVMEGLGEFHDPRSVDALIEGLGDEERLVTQTAHATLQRLTGQTLPFDPEGNSSARRSAQARWRDWWKQHRDEF